MYFGAEPNGLHKWWLRENGTPTVIWAVIAVGTCLLFLTLGFDDEAERKPLIIWVSLYLAALVRSRILKDRRGRYPALVPGAFVSKKVSKTLWLGSLALVLFFSMDLYSCPHGTLAGVLGAGIAHSEVGGPCRNRYWNLRSQHLFGDWYLWWS